MLYYEAGYLCDTSANTKYGVSEKFLLNTLHRGKIIHGVRLDKYGELQVYNFRKIVFYVLLFILGVVISRIGRYCLIYEIADISIREAKGIS